MKNVLILICCFFTFSISAQDSLLQVKMYEAYLNADNGKWLECINALDAIYEKSSDDTDLLALAKAQHASFTSFRIKKDTEGAQKIINVAQKNVEIYLKNNSKSAEANALLSGILGLQISLSPMKGMSLGSKSSSLADKAIKFDTMNAFANYQKGSSLYFTPRLWGGDVPQAIEHLEVAKRIYETQGIDNDWNYLNTLAILGQAYHYQEDLEKAKTSYDLALTTAPDFGWVKFNLLPKLEQDMD
jgi:tetratricopeptide (TPR) repeat protein